jgi:hypothetical protein
MIAFVVERTSHTLVSRRPGSDGCRTRVHTIADAFAMVDRRDPFDDLVALSLSLDHAHLNTPYSSRDKGCPGASSRETKS